MASFFHIRKDKGQGIWYNDFGDQRMPKLNTLIFDLDGTLVNSNELIVSTFAKTLKICAPEKCFTRTELIAMMGPPLSETLSPYTQKHTIPELIDVYRGFYKEDEPKLIKSYEGVKETLAYFAAKGFHMAIVTTKFHESAAPSLVFSGAGNYINVVIGLEDIRKPKPDPEPIFKALSYFPGANAIMIGDVDTDIQAGKNAGLPTVGVSWSYKLEALKQSRPDFMIDRFSDLIGVVERYNEEEN